MRVIGVMFLLLLLFDYHKNPKIQLKSKFYLKKKSLKKKKKKAKIYI